MLQTNSSGFFKQRISAFPTATSFRMPSAVRSSAVRASVKAVLAVYAE
jgi:hypothetical protein